MSKIINEFEELTSNILINNDMFKVPVDVVKIAKLNDIAVYEGDLKKSVSGVRIDIWTHLMRGCIINYVH